MSRTSNPAQKKIKLGGVDLHYTERAGLTPTSLLKALGNGEYLTLTILKMEDRFDICHVGLGPAVPLLPSKERGVS